MIQAIPALTSFLSARDDVMAAAAPRPAKAQADPAVREAAAQFLTELFFGPLLAEARKSPFGADWIDGGQTESIFGQQLDQRIADRVALADRGLNERIVAELSQHGKVRAAPARPVPPAGSSQASWPAAVGARGAKQEVEA